MNSIKDEGLVTQLAIVAMMMPKVKQYIDELIVKNEELEKEADRLSAHASELRKIYTARQMTYDAKKAWC